VGGVCERLSGVRGRQVNVLDNEVGHVYETSRALPRQHLDQLLDVFRRFLVLRFVLAQVRPDGLHLLGKRFRVFGQLKRRYAPIVFIRFSTVRIS